MHPAAAITTTPTADNTVAVGSGSESINLPQVIMFDLDGTLIDTMVGFADLAAEVMHRTFGDDVVEARKRYMATSGIPFRQQLEVIHPGHDNNDDASDEFERGKRAICNATRLETHTRQALCDLRDRGIKLVLSSNTAQHFVDEFVDREQVHFDLAFGFDAKRELAKGEPHVTRTTRQLGVDRDNILFVGDSLKDGQLAADTGVGFVGRVGTFDADQFEAYLGGVNTVSCISQLTALF